MRIRLGAALVTAALLTGVAPAAAALAAAGGHRRAARPAPSSDRGFRSRCACSHTAPDNPILLPREPGQSLVHDVFANAVTTASSTGVALRGARATSCSEPADTSAYRFPVLFQHGASCTRRCSPTTAPRAGPPRRFPLGPEMIA
jgi:hypothetical protein